MKTIIAMWRAKAFFSGILNQEVFISPRYGPEKEKKMSFKRFTERKK